MSRVRDWHRRHWPHIRTKHAQQVNLLLALRVGHVDHQLVAFRVADVREADASVAGSALDNRPARL